MRRGLKKPPPRRLAPPESIITSQRSDEDLSTTSAHTHNSTTPDPQISVDTQSIHIEPSQETESDVIDIVRDGSQPKASALKTHVIRRRPVGESEKDHRRTALRRTASNNAQDSHQSRRNSARSAKASGSSISTQSQDAASQAPSLQSSKGPIRRPAEILQDSPATQETTVQRRRRSENNKHVNFVDTEAIRSTSTTSPRKRRRVDTQEWQLEDDRSPNDLPTETSQEEPTARKTKSQARRRPVSAAKSKSKSVASSAHSVTAQASGTDGSAVVDEQEETRPRRRKRRKPSATPEGSEDDEVDLRETRMLDLCENARKGKLSSLEKLLREKDRSAAQSNAREELDVFMNGANTSPAQQAPMTDDQGSQEATRADPPPNPTHQQTIIRDGQIVLNDDAAQIDRHANAAAEREKNKLPPLEESDRTKRVTSGTWLKRPNNTGWNEQLVDRFYQGLRMFGTDFEMISRMFPGRSRRQIKLKFVKEERSNYPRIKATLLGETVPVVLEEYENISGKKYDETAHYDKEIENDRERIQEEQNVQTQLMQEANAERERQVATERETASEHSGNESSSSAKRKGVSFKGHETKTKSKKDKQKASKSKDDAGRSAEERGEVGAEVTVA